MSTRVQILKFYLWQPPVRIELTTPGLQDQCSNHWAMEAVRTHLTKISLKSYINWHCCVDWLLWFGRWDICLWFISFRFYDLLRNKKKIRYSQTDKRNKIIYGNWRSVFSNMHKKNRERVITFTIQIRINFSKSPKISNRPSAINTFPPMGRPRMRWWYS